jgi:hypothetical protein
MSKTVTKKPKIRGKGKRERANHDFGVSFTRRSM